MRVFSNTTPFIALASIDQLSLLPQLFGSVYVAQSVIDECAEGGRIHMDFESLRRLLIDDGYASTYILQPALEHKPEKVFYTLWNYDRLQWKWADEQGLKTRDLTEIKLAQIEEYQPDIFYNLSAFCDGDFIKLLGKRKGRKDIYWNRFIEATPRTYIEYDGQISLHRPFVETWRDRGLKALELQPAIPNTWKNESPVYRTIDVLFYGQYLRSGIFDNRNRLIDDLLQYKSNTGQDIRCHLTLNPCC